MPEMPLVANGPAPCIKLPVSSANLQPTSCWVTGPTSIIVAGVDARNPADGAVYLIDGQKKLRTDMPLAGRLTISSVLGSMPSPPDSPGPFRRTQPTNGSATSGGPSSSRNTAPDS